MAEKDNGFYITNPPVRTKDYYIDALQILQSELSKNSVTLLDVGCATGDFIELISTTFPHVSIFGLEQDSDYVKYARDRDLNACIYNGSILDPLNDFKNKFDVITVFGVVQQFDDLEITFRNLASWMRVGGKVLVFSHFNPYPIDVFIKYRQVNTGTKEEIQGGWNVHSLVKIEELSSEFGFKHQFIEFQIRSEILAQENKVRSWTYYDSEGVLRCKNGLGLDLYQGFFVLHKLTS